MTNRFKIDDAFFEDKVNEVKEGYPFPNKGAKVPLCMDIGANVGAWSMLFSEYCTELVSVEPYKPNYDFMVSKFKELGINNITIYNKAISTKDGEKIQITIEEGNKDSGSISSNDDISDSPKEVLGEVETISYSHLYNKYPNVGYLKVDCEGCEWDLLMDSKLDHIQILVVEMHPGFLGRKKVMKLKNYLGTQFKNVYSRKDLFGEVMVFSNMNTPLTINV